MRENRVRAHRQRLELTQKQLAERIGISRNHLTLIEIGRDNPSLEVAGRLASFLGVTIEEIFPWLKHPGFQENPEESLANPYPKHTSKVEV
jgi:putative transcriptional regulator